MCSLSACQAEQRQKPPHAWQTIDESLSFPPAAQAVQGACHHGLGCRPESIPRTLGDSHSGDGSHSFEACRVADHFIQGVDYLSEARTGVAVLLPAVQHQLVQGSRTVHGWWEPVILLNGIDDLQGSGAESSM